MFRIRPSLDRITRVLDALGNPQEQWPSLHMAGTNGKGSVAAALESVLRASGYRTGLYTSPHLVDLRERVRVDGEPVVDDFTAIAGDVLKAEKKARAPLTYFEFLTAIAFQAFARKKVDIGIIECGMGGLWDATNMLSHPLASLLTTVGLDHMEWLGKDERRIARQKAGIIKTHGYVISGVRGPGQKSVIRAAREKDATLIQLDQDFFATPLTASWRTGKQTLRFQFRGEPSEIVPFGLLGTHQIDNAALVMATLRHLMQAGWSIPAGRRDQGLTHLDWPGRLQIIRGPDQAPLLLDGAHNPPAMKMVLDSIASSAFANVRKIFIFSAFKDKDFNAMACMIAPLAAEICLCPLRGPRAAGVSRLRQAFSRTGLPVRAFTTPAEALARALQDTPRDGLIVVTGSLALVGEILKSIHQRELIHV